MYTIILEINQKCNLSCKYCYLGEISGSTMAYETAVKSIDMAYRNVKHHRDNKLWFHFVGGEALLDFKQLQKMVSYIRDKNKSEQKELIFSLTTNATLLNKEIVDWLVNNDFIVKISIDGDKETNDRNRISKNSTSVYDNIIKNWPYIKEYEEKSNKYVQVTNVVTKNNYQDYFKSLKYLVEELGVKVLDTALDLTVSWEEEELDSIMEGIRQSYVFYLDSLKNHREFYWNYINELKQAGQRKKQFYTCGAGLITHYVRTDGSLFACSACLDKEFSLGDTDQGLYPDKIEFLKDISGIQNESCRSCSIYEYCGARACLMSNLASNQDINKPNKTLCRLEQFKYGFFEEVKEELSIPERSQ